MTIRLVVLAAAAFLVTPGNASAATFFLFKPASAGINDRVTIRTGGTPANFTLNRRVKPFQGTLRLYLVERSLAPEIRSQFDSRLHFIGRLVVDRNGRGLLAFNVPPLASGDYSVAYWFSRTRKFGLQPWKDIVPRYEPLMRLSVAAPSPTEACPVTIPNGDLPPGLTPSPIFHGNGRLWTTLPLHGVYTRPIAKLIWGAAGVDGPFIVRYRRLDAPEPSLTAVTVRGTWQGFKGTASWASRMSFSEGCWLITGRVRDIALSFVMKVDLP